MKNIHERLRELACLLLVTFLVACEPEQSEHRTKSNEQLTGAEASTQDVEADIEVACKAYPTLPFCNSDPRPGFAKFAIGAADSVRWSGTARCHEIDFRTGREGSDRLIKAAGESKSLCQEQQVHFEFLYRQQSKELTSDGWTSAFKPLSQKAAERLLASCTGDSRPEPSAVRGSWWKANNTYAENLMLDYIAPVVYATELLPFSDEGLERLGEEVINGRKAVVFRNDVATVWMMADSKKNRPLRVVSHEGDTDAYFSEWDEPFAATIPVDIRSLDEICETQ